MKNLNRYIIEKLRISSKNNFSKDILIDFDYDDYDHNANKLTDVFSENDLNDIIVFANQLEKQPIKISNNFNGQIWNDFVILYYDEHERTRIIISFKSSKKTNSLLYERKYGIDIIYRNKTLYYKYGLDSLSQGLDEIEKGIDITYYFKKL